MELLALVSRTHTTRITSTHPTPPVPSRPRADLHRPSLPTIGSYFIVEGECDVLAPDPCVANTEGAENLKLARSLSAGDHFGAPTQPQTPTPRHACTDLRARTCA